MTQHNKTIILEKQTRQSVLMDHLKNNPSIGDSTYVSLNVFLNTLIRDERDQDWFTCARLLEEHASVGGILETTLRFPITIDHLMAFMQTMADEGWTLDDLPNTKPKETALKKILTVLVPHFQRRASQWETFMNLPNPQDLTVMDHFYPYATTQRLKTMEKKGLKLETFPQFTPNISVKVAKNPRSEAQACVQDILSNALPYDEQVIICLDEALQDQAETFLIRHEIPYFRVNEHKATSAFKLFEDLLVLRKDPSWGSLLNLIENDRLDLPSRMALIDYIKTFKVDVLTVLTPFHHVSTAFENKVLKDIMDDRAYHKLEKKAELEISACRSLLTDLMNLDMKDYETFISGFFDLFVRSFKTFSESDVQSINRIKSLLESGHAQLKQMKDPYPVLIYLIGKQTLSTKQSSGVILTDLKHGFVFHKQKAYFLGCSQDGYPQYGSHSGLFDEDYLKVIKGYDPKARYDHHMERLKTLRHGFKDVVYSYPLGNFEGKAQKLPYELERYFEENKVKASAWRIAEKYPQPKSEKPVLDPQLANKLYFPKGELRGSVSSLERYFKCPYQYFLYTGIGLGSPDTTGLSNREIGNLLHLVLEEGVIEYGKAYASSLRNQEAKRLDPLIDALKTLFPHQDQTIELMRERTIVLLKLSLEFLESRERNTLFSPQATEMSFDAVIDLGKGIPLHLVGFIDRVDTMDTGFMIIDYKSSTKSLKENAVMEGVQLQLCTYLWMGEQILGLKSPYGAFYFSLGQSNITVLANDPTDPEKIWKNGRRFSGWLTGDPAPVDLDGTHHTSLTRKENGDYTFTGGAYKAPAIEERMKELYQQLIDDLSDGIIAKRNKAGSCQYCPYKTFCQYKGTAVKLSKITKDTSVLR